MTDTRLPGESPGCCPATAGRNTTGKEDHQMLTHQIGDPGELSTELAHVADLDLQRAGFTICNAFSDGRLVATLDLLGPNWLDFFGRLDDALAHYGATLTELVSDPQRWGDVRDLVASLQPRGGSTQEVSG